MPPWDLSTVHRRLIGTPYETLQEVSTKDLTLKTAFLLAVVMARRIGDIQVLAIKDPYFKRCAILLVRVTDVRSYAPS